MDIAVYNSMNSLINNCNLILWKSYDMVGIKPRILHMASNLEFRCEF